MKFLIVGLGNMGGKYVGTRHNIGFEIVDYLAQELGGTFRNDTLGDLAEVKHKGRTLVLLKPSTYMNRSGKAVRYWMQKKKIEKSNVLVIVDDLNLPFGQLRMRAKGSVGGHNGIKDINQIIGQDYARLRFGIGNDFYKSQQIDFVLGKWNDQEMNGLLDAIKNAAEGSKSFTAIGIKYTMEKFNQKKGN